MYYVHVSSPAAIRSRIYGFSEAGVLWLWRVVQSACCQLPEWHLVDLSYYCYLTLIIKTTKLRLILPLVSVVVVCHCHVDNI